MGVRLFVGNLAYSTTEADLRAYFGAVAPPSQVVLPVDRETGRPRGFAFVEYLERSQAEAAIQRFNGQAFNGRPLAVSEARAREDRGPGGPRPSGPRPGGPPPRSGGFGPGPSFGGGSRPLDQGTDASSPRSRNFGPDARPQRGPGAKGKKREDRPRGPIPLKATGRSFTLDDDDSTDDVIADIDDFATSQPPTTELDQSPTEESDESPVEEADDES